MNKVKLVPWDVTRHLDSEEAIAEYISIALEEGDTDLLIAALGDVARARGMTQVASKAGLGRESLYKALAPGAKPRFETIMRVAAALGVALTARPARVTAKPAKATAVKYRPSAIAAAHSN